MWPRGELSVGEWWDDDGGSNPAFSTAEMLATFVDSMDGHVGAFDFALKVRLAAPVPAPVTHFKIYLCESPWL